MIITIDGPAGSGKSTTAKAIAKRLGIAYLDTGAMYRSVTLIALESGANLQDSDALSKIAADIDIRFEDAEEGQLVFINGVDRTRDIRTREVDRNVSAVSAAPGVRKEMVAIQRRIADNCGKIVGEGRDLGSVVFPDSGYRFYLDADPARRAERRALERGETITEEHTAEIKQRDRLDSSRETSPLSIPEGAIVIDNTLLSIDETVAKILEFIA